ncbi:MAG: hypothetical protein QM739_02445 [Propionivibrio sp.]
MSALWRLGSFLRDRQRWVLVALLVVLHLTLLAGTESAVGRMCWFVDVGFFILWQPFIHSERRLGAGTLLLLAAVLATGAWLFSIWFLILWVAVLASLLGGRVMMLGHRPTRIFYLTAFAYLLGALLVWLMPKVVPEPSLIGPSLETPFAWGAPLIFIVMLLIPSPREIRLPSRGMVDFFYSLFILLLISVVMLGSLAFMLLSRSLYIEAVFKTLVSMAAMLLLVAWAWNPRPGFSGIGVFLSRYLLTIGLPFETWLQRLMDCAAWESDPEAFLAQAFEGMEELPWVSGGTWSPAAGARAGSGRFGQASAFRQDFPGQPLTFTLFTQHKLSPALIWHFHLLLQLTNEYYATKQRAREFQQMSYLRAVHETGARLTHDVKNLLQSLNNLCYVAQSADETGGERMNQLLKRQLPQITQRLHQTLEKLQQPQGPQGAAGENDVPAGVWWEGALQRYAHAGVEFVAADFGGARVPAMLFDSVLDNLLQNALLKRQAEADLHIRVALSSDAAQLSVCDTGRRVPDEIAAELFQAPVSSEDGLGIGLYHAARQAEGYGFSLALTGNERGAVCFALARAGSAGGRGGA